MKRSIYTVCIYSYFFLICKLYSSGFQIMCLILDHLRFMTSVDIWGFWWWDVKKGQFKSLVPFSAVFIKYLRHGQCFTCGFLVFSFLVFSVYKNFKYNHHLLFLAVFPDLKMVLFWSVNYKSSSVNYNFILDMSKILDNIYISVSLVKSESVLILSLGKYTFFSHCTQNYILYFLEAKNPCFVIKKCSKSFYICASILSKK